MAIIKKKVMVKPMKKAKQGTIIPENPDQSNQLNKMKAETEAKLKRAKGIPINPQIRRDIRKGILDENGLYKKENDMKANMSRTPMKKGGAIKKAGMHKMADGSMMKNSMMKMGGAMKKAKNGFDLNKDGKTTFKDVLIGRGVLPKTAKSGASMKKCKYGCK